MLDEGLMGQLGALSKVDILAAIKVHLGWRVDPVQRSRPGEQQPPCCQRQRTQRTLPQIATVSRLFLAVVLGQTASIHPDRAPPYPARALFCTCDSAALGGKRSMNPTFK